MLIVPVATTCFLREVMLQQITSHARTGVAQTAVVLDLLWINMIHVSLRNHQH